VSSGRKSLTYHVPKPVESLEALALSLVLRSKLLGLVNHMDNLLTAETALLVGDGD
jgi:hypothetical protein